MDGINLSDLNSAVMGATGNPNAARIAALQEKRKSIEETLDKKNQELRILCMQEADLTGIIPAEMPLKPGESPPSVRRRMGTSYTIPDNLLNSTNKDETISDLELQIQLHINMAEAALGLANKQNVSKTVRRQHMTEYQKYKKEFTMLQEKLALAKEKALLQQQLAEQHKQKKKPRPPEHDDTVSMRSNDVFGKPELRHSLRSVRQQETLQEQRYSQQYARMTNRNSDMYYETSPMRYDDLGNLFYRLDLNGYKRYTERQESVSTTSSYYNYSHTMQHDPRYHQQQQHSPMLHMRNFAPQHSPVQQQHSPSNMHYSPQNSQHSPNIHRTLHASTSMQQMLQHSPQHSPVPHPQQRNYPPSMFNSICLQDYNNKYGSSPSTSSPSLPPKMYNPEALAHASGYGGGYRTAHQLGPHQQYEQAQSGLGGCWKKTESGEIFWCNSSNSPDAAWQRDKRCGSLDRRRNRRVHKKVQPNAENKCATLASVPYYPEPPRPASTKLAAPAPAWRTSGETARQLVRTQSLGSVGAQTFDGVWPSDDNSSCESEARSDVLNRVEPPPPQTMRRNVREKEWIETCLDGPVSPTHSIKSSLSQVVAPSVLAPEEKYVQNPVASPKSPLEIPAESNPSPRLVQDTSEMFNNNMLKNCTVVQAGHVKPYHEETKPFEMSDFYKYSTKYKKSPVKPPENNNIRHGTGRNLAESYSEEPQNAIRTTRSEYTNINELNNDQNNDNSWFRSHEQPIDNSNATLV